MFHAKHCRGVAPPPTALVRACISNFKLISSVIDTLRGAIHHPASQPQIYFYCIFCQFRTQRTTQFLQNVKIPTRTKVMATSVGEFPPKYMVRCNFSGVFLKKVIFRLQLKITLPNLKIKCSNLVCLFLVVFSRGLVQEFSNFLLVAEKNIFKKIFLKI